MGMKMKIKSLWDECIKNTASNQLGENEFQLKRIQGVDKFGIYVGIDSSKNYIVAYNVVSRPPSISLKSAAIDYLTIERPDKSWFMVLRLVDEKLLNVFQTLCEDLIDATIGCDSEFLLIQLIEFRLRSWEKLFQSNGTGLLAEFQIKGLLGELIFLLDCIDSNQWSIDATVSAWVGPQGADQDFIFPDKSFEIKTVNINGETISIASLDQLSSSLPITIIVIELLKVGAGMPDSFTLNEYVNKIEERVRDDPRSLMIFRSTLLESSYVRHDYYDNFIFSRNSLNRYNVDEEFPRLTTENVPDAIASCQYSINLDQLEKFKEL